MTTVHGRLDLPDLVPFYKVFTQAQLVSISDDQRRPLPFANFVRTIQHGLPSDLLPFVAEPRGGYLAFLGRISEEKRPDRAIEIATRAGMPLKIAAKVDRVDEAYWRETIAPMIAMNPNVEYVGEIGEREKAAFLGNASALLMPIDWPEPFGLVMIEAMSCGTPTIAFRRGSVPEVLEDGRSGFVVEDVAEAVRACGRIDTLDRAGVRSAFEERFTASRMANDYLDVYRTMAGVSAPPTFVPGIADQQPPRAGRDGHGRASMIPMTESGAREAFDGIVPHYAVVAHASLGERRARVLKSGDTFAVLDPSGDVLSGRDSSDGLFHRDTRHLSHLDLTIAAERPILLSSVVARRQRVAHLRSHERRPRGCERRHRA